MTVSSWLSCQGFGSSWYNIKHVTERMVPDFQWKRQEEIQEAIYAQSHLRLKCLLRD